MPRFVYGDSYGGVAQHELALDAARDNRFFNSLQARRALEAMALQQQQAEIGNALAVAQLAENNRRYRDDIGMRRQAMQQSFLERLMQNRQAEDRLSQAERIAQMRYGDAASERDYGEAQAAITRGMIRPEDLPAAFPRLNPLHQSRLGTYFRSLAGQEEADIGADESAAGTANAQLSLMRMAKGITDAKSGATKAKRGFNWPPWLAERAIDRQLAEQIANLEAGRGLGEVELDADTLSKFVNQTLRDGRLSWDPEKEVFIPAPATRIFTKPGSRVMSRPAAPAPPAVGLTGPSAGVGEIRKWAMESIRRGASPSAVNQRLAAMGIEPL